MKMTPSIYSYLKRKIAQEILPEQFLYPLFMFF